MSILHREPLVLGAAGEIHTTKKNYTLGDFGLANGNLEGKYTKMKNEYYGTLVYARIGLNPQTDVFGAFVKMTTEYGERHCSVEAGDGRMERFVEKLLRHAEVDSIGKLRGRRVRFMETERGCSFRVMPEESAQTNLHS